MANRKCYDVRLNGVFQRGDFVPCGPASPESAVTCCYANHICMDNSFCAYLDTANNKTGYYVSGCTDPNFKDPSCRSECGSHYVRDAIWNYRQDQRSWTCCAADEKGHAKCYPPSGPDFTNAPGQLLLRPLASINAASSAVPLTTAVPTSISTIIITPSISAAATTSPAATMPNSGLGTGGNNGSGSLIGGIIAIVIGVILFASWVIGGIYIFRKRKLEKELRDQTSGLQAEQESSYKLPILPPHLVEVGDNSVPMELSSRGSTREFPAHEYEDANRGRRW